MTLTQTITTKPDKKSAKKRQQSFPSMDIGSPKVPLRKPKKITQEPELLSDWEHAS
ncbi:hypothetical protein [Nostoc sp. UHCC 0870]|jgi:hypothetical protein|uniref:hypothetical protein n=1 Tax=Nostoc sp. UHCC 0870 TaxID=2914041 RepID=UPI001EDE35A2|nr:hypothetical protein [Nostoc sp. UHCC 0870]UKO96792.1 hypothetical protein L6494_19580 [Nostoc sp. UHCC 0870]